MQFAFSEEQRFLQGVVRDFLEREWSSDRLRRAWIDPADRTALWRGLTGLGVAGMTVPERHGGLGMDELDLVLVLEELGRGGVPGPIVETIAVGVPLLVEAGGEELHGAWLRPIAEGRALIAASLDGGPFVVDADLADLVLVAKDGVLRLFRRGEATLAHQPSLDGARRLFTISAGGSAIELAGDRVRAAIEAAFDRGALAVSAQLVGLASRMIDMTVDYVKVREQFGRPVGSFQAVKHHLADALVALEMARPAVYRAAYALARREPDRAVFVSMAKSLASEAATIAARKALQCHGAIGYSFEHALHLYMKRAWALAAAWGDPAWHRERIARRILDRDGKEATS